VPAESHKSEGDPSAPQSPARDDPVAKYHNTKSSLHGEGRVADLGQTEGGAGGVGAVRCPIRRA
jgi:hypothetical protein